MNEKKNTTSNTSLCNNHYSSLINMNKKNLILLVLIAHFCLTACNHKEQLGKYIYKDRERVIHSRPDCKCVASEKNSKPLKRYKTADYNRVEDDWLCSECICDDLFESLMNKKSYDWDVEEVEEEVPIEEYEVE